MFNPGKEHSGVSVFRTLYHPWVSEITTTVLQPILVELTIIVLLYFFSTQSTQLHCIIHLYSSSCIIIIQLYLIQQSIPFNLFCYINVSSSSLKKNGKGGQLVWLVCGTW